MKKWLQDLTSSHSIKQAAYKAEADYLESVRRLLRTTDLDVDEAIEAMAMRVGLDPHEKTALHRRYSLRYGSNKPTLKEYLREYWEDIKDQGYPEEAIVNELHAETGLDRDRLIKIVSHWFAELPEYKEGDPSGTVDSDFDVAPFTAPQISQQTAEPDYLRKVIALRRKKQKKPEEDKTAISPATIDIANKNSRVIRDAMEVVRKGESSDPVRTLTLINQQWRDPERAVNQKKLTAIRTLQNIAFLRQFDQIRENLITEALRKNPELEREDISAGTTNFEAFKQAMKAVEPRLVLSPSQPSSDKVICLICGHEFAHPDSELAQRSGGYVTYIAQHLRSHGLTDVSGRMTGRGLEVTEIPPHPVVEAAMIANPQAMIPDPTLLTKYEWKDRDQATISAYLRLFPFATIGIEGRGAYHDEAPAAIRSRKDELGGLLRSQRKIVLPTSETVYVDKRELSRQMLQMAKTLNIGDQYINPQTVNFFVDVIYEDLGIDPKEESFTGSTREILASMEDVLYDYYMEFQGTGIEPDPILWKQRRGSHANRPRVRLDEQMGFKGSYTSRPSAKLEEQMKAQNNAINMEEQWLAEHADDVSDLEQELTALTPNTVPWYEKQDEIEEAKKEYQFHSTTLETTQKSKRHTPPPQARSKIIQVDWTCGYCGESNGQITEKEQEEYQRLSSAITDPRFQEKDTMGEWLRDHREERHTEEYRNHYQLWSDLKKDLPSSEEIGQMKARLKELESTKKAIERPDTARAEWSQQCRHCGAWFIRPITTKCPHPNCEALNRFEVDKLKAMGDDYFKPGAAPGSFELTAKCYSCGRPFALPIPRYKQPAAQYQRETPRALKVTETEKPKAELPDISSVQPKQTAPETQSDNQEKVEDQLTRSKAQPKPVDVQEGVRQILRDYLKFFKEMIPELGEEPLTEELIRKNFAYFLELNDTPSYLRVSLGDKQIEQLLTVQKQELQKRTKEQEPEEE